MGTLRHRREQRRHRRPSFVDFPLDSWQTHLNVNVTGVLLCTPARRPADDAAPLGAHRQHRVGGRHARRRGRTHGIRHLQAAVIGLTRQMAVELAEHGITANAVAPGPVDTPMTRVLHSPEFRRSYTSAIPMHRYGAESRGGRRLSRVGRRRT